MKELQGLSLTKVRELLHAREISSEELTRQLLEVVEKRNGQVNAYLEVFDDALAQAKAADARIASGESGAVLGVPLAIKDNILIEGRRVGAASKILEGYVASYDASAIGKLRASGAVFVGRTNMDEFAMGGSTENSAYGATKNPHDETRVAGGSSGGSAAAVAMGGACAALGSDTGGSVRQPSSFCGVVGLKPTYGAISRYGLIAMGSSLDQIGPIGKSVSDVQVLFDVMRGRDSLDSTNTPPELYPKGGKPMTIGIPYHFLGEGMETDARAVFDSAVKKMENAGYRIKDIKLPSVTYALPVYYIVMPAEASTNLARFDGVRYGLRRDGKDMLDEYLKTRGFGFGPEVRRRIILGTYVLSAGYYDAYYRKADALRRVIAREYQNAFEDVDLIVTPTTPGPSFKVGAKQDPLSLYLEDIFTVPANLTGLPAMSVPSGVVSRDGQDVPLGIQFTAPQGGEGSLFAAGIDFEQVR